MRYLVLNTVIASLWIVAAAYAANGFPPLMRGRRPIDRGFVWVGRPLLGAGKTIEGTAGGILFGLFIGWLQVAYQHEIPAAWGLDLMEITMPMVILLVAGTILGDYLGSFFKRRAGIKRGDHVVLLDQIGFLVAALLLVSLAADLNPIHVITLLIITPPIHWASNVLGYYMRVKKTPW